MMAILHRIREGKRNTKRVLLMTDSQELTESYLREIHENPHFGYEVIGYVGNLAIDTLKHLGQTNELDRILGEHHPDEVVMAFETVRRRVMTKYVSVCDEHCIKVLVVPAVCGFLKSPKQIKQMVAQLPQGRIKSKTVQREGIEMTVELRVRQSETGFVDKFMRVEGVYDATLIAHQGDMIS